MFVALTRLLEARSDLFFIKRVFPSFKKVGVTNFKSIGDGVGRVTDTRVHVVFDGGMCSEGVRVQSNETRALIKMRKIAFWRVSTALRRCTIFYIARILSRREF